jgi:hypothetical protein
MGDPAFQSGSSELEAVRQCDRLVNSRAVMKENAVQQAVYVPGFGQSGAVFGHIRALGEESWRYSL